VILRALGRSPLEFVASLEVQIGCGTEHP
jgi:hypothetical protein